MIIKMAAEMEERKNHKNSIIFCREYISFVGTQKPPIILGNH